MTPDLLQRCGEALYGPRWQSDLSRDLQISDRTMRRWIADGGVPDGVYRDLRELCRHRAKELSALIARLP